MSNETENYHRVIGIDLGTTYSAVAAYNRYTEEAEILKNLETDEATTPSVISLDPLRGSVIVGQVAKRNRANNPANTVIEVKREMGEMFRPETLIKYDPEGEGRFRAKGDRSGKADPVRIKFANAWFLPQEISAFTLMKMKQIASEHLGTEIIDAVVTVPAYFTEKQRKATEEAARLAGLYPRQLISEPTAAAICYGVDQFEEERKVYLVYDLGGGTFDVSIISVEEDSVEVISTSGDPRLGGGDFDDAITRWATEELEKQFHLDVSNDPVSLAIIKYHAENAKKALSTYESDKLVLLQLRPDHPPTLELTRKKFEELIYEDLGKSLNYADEALALAEKNAQINREDIDAVLLVGGSSKIPCVRDRLLGHFQRDESFLKADLNPDAVVARGAAILAKRFKPSEPPFDIARTMNGGEMAEDEDDIIVHHITEHSLGVGVSKDGESMVSHIVSQGTNIPVAVAQGGYTNGGADTHIPVLVYQGEGEYAVENELIGIVQLGPMEPMPAGHHKFEVTFALDRSGLLSAVVNHLNEGKTYYAQFQHETGIGSAEALGLRREKLSSMFAEAPKRRDQPAPDSIPPPPAPPQPETETVDEPSGTGTEVQAVPETQTAEPVPETVSETVDETPPPATSVQTAPSPEVETIELRPEVEVPVEFKSILRLSRKQVMKQPDPQLLDAVNEFVSALNDGIEGEALEDLGDAMNMALIDSRR